MNEYVMSNRKLPGQLVIVQAWDESDLSQMEAAGWKVTKKDPDEVRDDVQPAPEPPAEPVNTKK